jgi:hypothetical protein
MQDFVYDPYFGRTWRKQAFRSPVGRDYDNRMLLWRPGADPATVYRKTSAFRSIAGYRALATLGFLVLAGALASGVRLAVEDDWGAAVASLLIALVLMGAIFYIAKEGIYADRVERVQRRWHESCPDVQAFIGARLDPQNLQQDLPYGFGPANLLVALLETIQDSQAAASGVVSTDRLKELHRYVWTVTTEAGWTGTDTFTEGYGHSIGPIGESVIDSEELREAVKSLQRVAAEVAQVDEVLARHKQLLQPDQETSSRREFHADVRSLADELRAFRDLMSDPGQESK